MKSITLYTCSVLIILTTVSCKKLILGESEINDPVNNFEIFWNDFNENYALFEIRGWNWDSIYSVYQPQINTETTNDTLWKLMTEAIEYLDDGHTFLYDPRKRLYYESGSYFNDLAEKEFDLELVKSKYTEPLTSIAEEVNFQYGKLKNKSIGYIYLDAMDGYDGKVIDEVMIELKQYDALIFDVRNNSGGDDAVGARIAGAFADKSTMVYTVEEKNGPGHTDFDEKIEFYSQPIGEEQFLKPVIMLTDRYSVSACETFLMHMTVFDQVTQIGDTTAGDFSDVSMMRFLPNGWVYSYSIMQYLLPNGQSLDGVGHVPDVYIKNTISQQHRCIRKQRSCQDCHQKHWIGMGRDGESCSNPQ